MVPESPRSTPGITQPSTQPQAFEAHYAIFEGDKKVGESRVRLVPDNKNWRLTNTTRGTHGLASLLGFRRQEETLFNWHLEPTEKQGWLPVAYQFSQKVAFKKKTRSFHYDHTSGLARGKSDGRQWMLNVHPPFISPNLVVLALAVDLCSGQQEMHYRVLDKGALKDYHFVVNGTDTESGLIKITKKHSRPDRITESWHDPKRQCLNVRSRHKEPGGDWLETRLVSTSLRSPEEAETSPPLMKAAPASPTEQP